jgi:hypothetical protein
MRDTVTIIPNFITTEECDVLNTWVENAVKQRWLDRGITTGGARYSGRLTTRMYANRFDQYDPLAYKIRDRIRKTLNIENLSVSISGGGKHGIVVSYTHPGGDVYLHSDPKEGKLEVLRCNIITQMAESGAQLTVDGKEYNINRGDLHCYLASKYPHQVSQVAGNTPRILWMFGFQTSDSNWENEC